MIDKDNFLDGISGAALWCGADFDSADLAQAVSIAIDKNIESLSVIPESVSIVWPWLENKGVDIFSRFYLKSKNSESISDITEKINSSFKQGADGAQVFLSFADLEGFVSQLYLIRDDLFFNKSVFIGMDISEIGPFDWKRIFAELKKMRATGLILALTKDEGDKSDFVGRVYAALDELDADDISLHFMLGANKTRIEQVYRLVEAIRPNLLAKLKFFINA